MDGSANPSPPPKHTPALRLSLADELSLISEQPSGEQDLQYSLIRSQILQSGYFQSASKHMRIRLQSWIHRLDKIRINHVWKANRNNYIKLLNLMCHCEFITDPFTAFPHDNDLPTLKKHEINHIIDRIEGEVRAHSRPGPTKPQQLKEQTRKVDKVVARKNSKQVQNVDKKRIHGVSADEGMALTRKRRESIKECKSITLRSEIDGDLQDNPHGSKLKEIALIFNSISTQQKSKRSTFYSSSKDQRVNAHNEAVAGQKFFEGLANTYYSSQLVSEKVHKLVKQRQNDSFARQSHQLPEPKKLSNRRQPRQIDHLTINLAGDQNSGSIEYLKLPQHREYWESNSYTSLTGNCTPKYLNHYNPQPALQINESMEDSEPVITNRTENHSDCECTNYLLRESWLGKLFLRGA